MNKKGKGNGLFEKAVVLAIVAVFIGSAFVPAVGSQVESILATQSSENEDIKIGNEEIVQLTKNKLNNLEDGSSLWDRLVGMFNRLFDILGNNPIFEGLRELFTDRNTMNDNRLTDEYKVDNYDTNQLVDDQLTNENYMEIVDEHDDSLADGRDPMPLGRDTRGPWWNTSWQYRKEIAIDHDKVDADLTNFPVLITLSSDSDLADDLKCQNDGDDIVFTNESGSKFAHEIELFNGTSGRLIAWMNVTYLSSTQDTIIYMYYGNNSCSSMEDVEGTWNTNYAMVQHLNETSGTHYDSTNNSNDGTNFGSTQDSVGKVDGANSFDGTDDYVRVPNDPTLQFNEGSFTVEIWVKPATGTDNVRIINDRGTGGGGSYKGWQLKISASAGKWKFKDTGIDDATGNYKTYEGSTTYTYDEWHHIAMVYDADNELRCYVNGDLDGTLSVGSYGNITNSLPTAIGAAIASNGVEGTKSQFFNGGVDEVRLSNIVRNASWIKACYLNQHDPSSFYSFASPYPGPNVTVVSPADNISVENSVDFSFTPEFYAPIDGSEQAELWFNTTVVNNGSVFYSDSCRPQRGVIKNGKLYELEGGKITIRDFPNGTILRQGSTFGATHSNTAPVIVDDVVYGLNINGGLQAYNETSGTVVWTTSVGPGGSYSTTANSMELYDNHLYLQSKDHVIHKINITDGSETDNMTLDSGSTLKAHMLVDYQHDRLYALGNSRYYCIDLLSFSEIWNISFVANGGGSTRGGPVLVNDSNSEQYLTIITTFPQTYTYAVDFNGSIVWTWTTKTVRALATYNPNTGLIYLTDATGYTDAGYNLPVPGNIYAVYVKNGTTKWVTHGTGGNDRFSRPTTTSGDYLVWKTDNSGMNDYLYVANATTGEILAKVTAGDDRGYWCYPPALSGGYVATGGGYMHNGATPTLDIYHIGDGDWVDYYPLHANVNHTGYVENGLTSLGFINETWSCRKINETPLVNNSVNTIDFDFSSYNLPFNFTWNIHVIQSDDQDVWGDSRNVRVLPANMSPSVSSPSPVNNAVNVPTDLTQISIDISDPESDLFNWTIETSPDIGSSSSILDSDGVKTCSISGLDYNTTYTWFVNTSDVGSNGWTNRTYSFTTESPPGAWWNIGWGYRKSIVIDHNEVSGNLSYFPVLIDITDSNLSTKAQPDGDDFVFTDYNGNQLNHEIEYYDNSTGHLVVWVNVTSLSSMQDTVLYMYYGNLSCGNQQNIPGVWRSEFVMVQHLNETSGLHYDSTSYGNNGTAQSSVDQDATGQIDGADEFDDTVNAFIDVGIDSSMDIYGSNNDFSIWLWVKRDNIENLDGFFTSGSSGPNGIFFGAKSADENDLRFMSPGNTVTVDSTGDVIGDTGWHLVVLTADRDGVMRFWVDGVSVTSSDISGHAGENWNRVDDTYKVGTDRSEGNPMDGLLDEICVYNGVLSVDWVVTGFINQNDTSGFYSAGSEETLSDIIPPEISDVQATPPSTSQGGYVNITCDVTDNVDVDTVNVSISGPGGFTPVNTSMTEGSYYYNTTYTILGTYNYFIWANDTSGNSNMSTGHSFSIVASGAPIIVDNSPDTAGTGDDFIVNVTVTDSDGVIEAWVEYWFDSGSKTNMSMSNTGGNYWEYDSISIPSDSDDDLYYNISAKDSYTVWGHLDNQHVVVTDDDLPEIDNVLATPPSTSQGGYVNITCDVTDNIDVDTVKVDITGPAGFTPVNTSMTEGSYYYNTTYTVVGTYNFFIWANDTSGNSNMSSVEHFSVTLGNQPPTHDNPLLESELGTDTTDEYLICSNQSTSDPDDDDVYNTYHWFKDGASLTNMLMSFNTENSTSVKDYSGYGNNGTITGATWTSSGIVGGAYSFDGTDDYISIPDDSTLDGDGTWSEMTIEHWIYLDSNQTGGKTIAKYVSAAADDRAYQIGISSSTANKLYGAIVKGSDNYWSVTYDTPLNLSRWYHVVITYKSGSPGELILYVNGQNVSEKVVTTPGNIQACTGDLYLGWRESTSGYFEGKIDEVKIYPFALTAEQINQSYLQSKDGSSSNATIVSDETNVSEIWMCEITPSDGQIDGITKQSNSLTIVDIVPPEIDNVQASPSLALTGEYVNITCAVTDNNNDVNMVKVNITYPDDSTINETMLIGSYYYNTTHNQCGTYTYFIWANDTSGNSNTSSAYTFSVRSDEMLVDSEFNDSTDSADLRADDSAQDWYESRDDDPTLLTLDISDIAGNTGKKAALKGYGSSPTAYLDQNFSSIQAGTFNVSFDIYIENMSDYSNYDRTGFIFIGDDNGATNGPCSTSVERFVFLAFYDSTPGETGNDLEIRARTLSSQSWGTTSAWTSVATDLSYDTWYTIRLEVDFANSCYDVYINDTLIGDNILGYSGYASSSVTDISFSVGGTARGDFYLDNVFAPAEDRHKLNIDVVGNGSVVVDPGESTYANGTAVELTATADPGWIFSHWYGDHSGSTNPDYVTMTGDMTITANFTRLTVHYIDLEPDWNIISIPCYETIAKTDITVRNNSVNKSWNEAVSEGIILGHVYDFDRDNQSYNLVGSLEPGFGYWIWSNYDCDLLISSDAVGSGHITDLKEEWDIMGAPYNVTIGKTSTNITNNSIDYSWNDAVAADIILGFVYGWNTTDQMYELCDDFVPGRGYWMYAYYDCTLKRS